MRVVQLDPFALTPYYNAALCEALVKEGCAVRYVTSEFLYDTDMSYSESFHTQKLYFPSLKQSVLVNHLFRRRALRLASYWAGHRALLHSLKCDLPDVVHIQWSRLPILDLCLIKRIQKLGIPIVHTVHDVEPLFPYAQDHVLSEIYVRANRLIVHSAANKQALLKRHPQINGDYVHVIPHLLPAIPSSGISYSKARQILNIPKEATVILFFGSIRPYKSLDTLIEAYLQARCDNPDLWIVIAGRLADRSAALVLPKLQDQALVHLEYIPRQRLEIYHRAADIALFPYRRVSQSGALITAMGFGLPVIVTSVGAMPETVDGNGWIVEAGNVPALTRAILDAASDPVRLTIMAARSIELISRRHNSSLVAQQLMAIYNSSYR